VVFSNILGIFFMAHSLKHISVILADLVKELKEDNDKWEKANESTTTLRSSNDGKTSKGEQIMSIHSKLMKARLKLQTADLKKSGHNKFAGYKYFELGDFLPTIQEICNEVGICGTVTFYTDIAILTITDMDDVTQFIEFKCPMSSAALKGCHDVQNLGAVQTYLRRYLWTNAFEIVEHDAIDASAGAVIKMKDTKAEDFI
jgi:hypothetical protein